MKRATGYSKGATKGDGNTVWENFDSRQKAKVGKADDAGDEALADMFAK